LQQYSTNGSVVTALQSKHMRMHHAATAPARLHMYLKNQSNTHTTELKLVKSTTKRGNGLENVIARISNKAPLSDYNLLKCGNAPS